MDSKIKILYENCLRKSLCMVVGTRPGIIMFSPLIRECVVRKTEYFVIHTGQHYSYNMDKLIFDELDLPRPKYHLERINEKKYHGAQTAAMLEGIEKILLDECPFLVLVGGDANTNLAGALAARKLHINVGHIEAGERSYDWRMPEEHNRRMIDHISNYLFTTNQKGATQLKQEKVMGEVMITGNTIVDAAYQNFEIAKKKSDILEKFGLSKKKFCILTTHREENVDFQENLRGILDGVDMFATTSGLQIFFAAHPRTLNRIEQFGLLDNVSRNQKIILSEAPGYLDFLKLLASARMILTDSGGVQQEACIFKIPCVTLRENTEWTETIDIGANTLCGTNPQRILQASMLMLDNHNDWEVPFGPGNAAKTIVNFCEDLLNLF